MKNNVDASGKLFDFLKDKFRLKNDAALSVALDVAPPVISKIRHGSKITPGMMIRIHEAFHVSIAEIRQLISEEA